MKPMVPWSYENQCVGKRQGWNPVHLVATVCCAIAIVNGCGQTDQPTSNANQSQGGAPAALFPLNQVEYSYARSPASFAALWSQARIRPVRIALLGDLQETSPGGTGDVYGPRINYEAWLRYGNAPEAFVVGYGTYNGETIPFADWLLSGATAAKVPTPYLRKHLRGDH